MPKYLDVLLIYNTNCVYLEGIVHIWFHISYISGLIQVFICDPCKQNKDKTILQQQK